MEDYIIPIIAVIAFIINKLSVKREGETSSRPTRKRFNPNRDLRKHNNVSSSNKIKKSYQSMVKTQDVAPLNDFNDNFKHYASSVNSNIIDNNDMETVNVKNEQEGYQEMMKDIMTADRQEVYLTNRYASFIVNNKQDAFVISEILGKPKGLL
jgi:hypothetical protein